MFYFSFYFVSPSQSSKTDRSLHLWDRWSITNNNRDCGGGGPDSPITFFAEIYSLGLQLTWIKFGFYYLKVILAKVFSESSWKMDENWWIGFWDLATSNKVLVLWTPFFELSGFLSSNGVYLVKLSDLISTKLRIKATVSKLMKYH